MSLVKLDASGQACLRVGSNDVHSRGEDVVAEGMITKAGNSLSMMLTPTVSNHGATFVTVPSIGPAFPADVTTEIPFLIEWKAPMAMVSSSR
ncbi:hypothetical protein HPP92_022117 [Vanilla planifolia]|uniref:Uncharacterized protein n=1 Tax=Vanilla planifolia TaxID=51239 RepID=A0A835PNI4_VANPL|nr:hypothetical protein HPP92_022423 [Vanilla planifolia]KAG0458989.1 hypothetical protein HPP92_022117 [Vanilla planifolia]